MAKTNFVPSATIRGETLVLSLPDAKTPVVWQFDLSSVKASALEVNTDAGDVFALRLKTPRGEIHDIAVYASRDQAVDILAIVHQALANTSGVRSSKAVAANDTPRSNNWPLAASVVIIFVSLLWISTKIFPAPRAADGARVPAVTSETPSQIKSGVPVSADDILNGAAN